MGDEEVFPGFYTDDPDRPITEAIGTDSHPAPMAEELAARGHEHVLSVVVSRTGSRSG